MLWGPLKSRARAKWKQRCQAGKTCSKVLLLLWVTHLFLTDDLSVSLWWSRDSLLSQSGHPAACHSSPLHITVSLRGKPVNSKCHCKLLDLARKIRWGQFLFQASHCQAKLHPEPRGSSQASTTFLPHQCPPVFFVLVSACVAENGTVLFLCQRDLMLVFEYQMSLTGSCL